MVFAAVLQVLITLFAYLAVMLRSVMHTTRLSVSHRNTEERQALLLSHLTNQTLDARLKFANNRNVKLLMEEGVKNTYIWV